MNQFASALSNSSAETPPASSLVAASLADPVAPAAAAAASAPLACAVPPSPTVELPALVEFVVEPADAFALVPDDPEPVAPEPEYEELDDPEELFDDPVDVLDDPERVAPDDPEELPDELDRDVPVLDREELDDPEREEFDVLVLERELLVPELDRLELDEPVVDRDELEPVDREVEALDVLVVLDDREDRLLDEELVEEASSSSDGQLLGSGIPSMRFAT